MGRPGGRCCTGCMALFKIDADTGSIRWTKNLGFSVSAVKCHGNRIYAAVDEPRSPINKLYDIIVMDLDGNIIKDECISCFPRERRDYVNDYKQQRKDLGLTDDDLEYEKIIAPRYYVRDIFIFQDAPTQDNPNPTKYISLICKEFIFQVVNGVIVKSINVQSDDYWINGDSLYFLSNANRYNINIQMVQYLPYKIIIKKYTNIKNRFSLFNNNFSQKELDILEGDRKLVLSRVKSLTTALVGWNKRIDEETGKTILEYINVDEDKLKKNYGATISINDDKDECTIEFEYNTRGIIYPRDSMVDSSKSTGYQLFTNSMGSTDIGYYDEGIFNSQDIEDEVDSPRISKSASIFLMGENPPVPNVYLTRLNGFDYTIDHLEFRPNQTFKELANMIDAASVEDRPFLSYTFPILSWSHYFYGWGYLYNIQDEYFYHYWWYPTYDLGESYFLYGYSYLDDWYSSGYNYGYGINYWSGGYFNSSYWGYNDWFGYDGFFGIGGYFDNVWYWDTFWGGTNFGEISRSIQQAPDFPRGLITIWSLLGYYPGDYYDSWLYHYHQKSVANITDYEDTIVEYGYPKPIFPLFRKNGKKSPAGVEYYDVYIIIDGKEIIFNQTATKESVEDYKRFLDFYQKFLDGLYDVGMYIFSKDLLGVYKWLPWYAEILKNHDKYAVSVKTNSFIADTINIVYKMPFPKKTYATINNNHAPGFTRFISDTTVAEYTYYNRNYMDSSEWYNINFKRHDYIKKYDKTSIAKLNAVPLSFVSKSYYSKSSKTRVVNGCLNGSWGMYYNHFFPTLHVKSGDAKVGVGVTNKIYQASYNTNTKIMISLNDNKTYDVIRDDMFDYSDYRMDIVNNGNTYYYANRLDPSLHKELVREIYYVHYPTAPRRVNDNFVHQFRDYEYSTMKQPFIPSNLAFYRDNLALTDKAVKYNLSNYNNNVLNCDFALNICAYNTDSEFIIGSFNDANEDMDMPRIEHLDGSIYVKNRMKYTCITYNFKGETNGDFIFQITRKDKSIVKMKCNIDKTYCSDIVDFISNNGCEAELVKEGRLSKTNSIAFYWRDIEDGSEEKSELKILKNPYETNTNHIYKFKDGEMKWKKNMFMEPRTLTPYIDGSRAYNSYYDTPDMKPIINCVDARDDNVYVATSYVRIISRGLDNKKEDIESSHTAVKVDCTDYKNKELQPYIDFPYKKKIAGE